MNVTLVGEDSSELFSSGPHSDQCCSEIPPVSISISGVSVNSTIRYHSSSFPATLGDRARGCKRLKRRSEPSACGDRTRPIQDGKAGRTVRVARTARQIRRCRSHPSHAEFRRRASSDATRIAAMEACRPTRCGNSSPSLFHLTVEPSEEEIGAKAERPNGPHGDTAYCSSATHDTSRPILGTRA